MLKNNKNSQDTTASDLIKLDFEKQAAQIEASQKENVYGVWAPIWKFLRWYDKKKGKHIFKKKTYLILLVCLGWIGGHRYYQGRFKLALLYTIFFWTGVPFIICVTDFMEVFPMKADKNGKIIL